MAHFMKNRTQSHRTKIEQIKSKQMSLLCALVEWLWEETRIKKVVGSNHSTDTGWVFFHFVLL